MKDNVLFELSTLKGAQKVSEKTKAANIPMPPMFFMFPMPGAFARDWGSSQGGSKERARELQADMKTHWKNAIDMQKSSIDASRDQFERFLGYMTDMRDDFAEFLPDGMPWMPAWAEPPKAFRETLKEWEELAKDHFFEQADLFTDFFIDSQQKACEQIPDASENSEEQEAAAEAKPEAATAKKPAATKKAGATKKPRAAATKKTEAAEPAAAKAEATTAKRPATAKTKTTTTKKPAATKKPADAKPEAAKPAATAAKSSTTAKPKATAAKKPAAAKPETVAKGAKEAEAGK